MGDVQHDETAHRFSLKLDGMSAELDYEREPQSMRITHTLVPSAFRGRGVAAQLMRSALNYADQQGLNVVPVCSYAIAYMQQNAAGAGQRHREELLDEALEESFPASDPPSVGRVD